MTFLSPTETHRNDDPRWGALTLLAAVLVLTSASSHGQTRPSQLELVQLPKYCWGQHLKEFAGQPGYSIQDCGGGMNHFCSGLIYMMRANKPGIHRTEKINILAQARVEIQYTLARVTPNCPILTDVQIADRRLHVMETVAGIKPRK